jgi:hypothetical protein
MMGSRLTLRQLFDCKTWLFFTYPGRLRLMGQRELDEFDLSFPASPTTCGAVALPMLLNNGSGLRAIKVRQLKSRRSYASSSSSGIVPLDFESPEFTRRRGDLFDARHAAVSVSLYGQTGSSQLLLIFGSPFLAHREGKLKKFELLFMVEHGEHYAYLLLAFKFHAPRPSDHELASRIYNFIVSANALCAFD